MACIFQSHHHVWVIAVSAESPAEHFMKSDTSKHEHLMRKIIQIYCLPALEDNHTRTRDSMKIHYCSYRLTLPLCSLPAMQHPSYSAAIISPCSYINKDINNQFVI